MNGNDNPLIAFRVVECSGIIYIEACGNKIGIIKVFGGGSIVQIGIYAVYILVILLSSSSVFSEVESSEAIILSMREVR